MAKKRTIGVLLRESGVKVTTIRYYETIGLIAEPNRTTSGQRIYDATALYRLNFIRHARDLGFSIESIRNLIDLQERPGTDCASVDRIARRHLADVRHRMTQLVALEAELKRMVKACEGGAIASCAVLETLGDHGKCLDHHTVEDAFSDLGHAL